MELFRGEPGFRHDEIPGVGILLANLGTPEAPTPKALRRYLKEFLWDPRVIEEPRWKWWLILHLFVLTKRPRESAKLYAKIWTPAGSPLLLTTRRQARRVEERLRQRLGGPLHVAIGMRYGEPSIARGLRELQAKGCRRLLFLPLYPQYSGTTTASTFDALAAELTTWRWVPDLRTIHSYHDEPGYVRALAASIRELWQRDGEPEKLLFSFHGIPLRYFRDGDPYFCHCHKTARLVAEELGIAEARWVVAFQSLFGKEEWIKPYTDKTVEALAKSGVGSLDVVCPGFSADCLETLEEIDQLNREIFERAGGGRFRYIPCLNDRPDHIETLVGLVERHLAGWTVPREEWNPELARQRAAETARRATAMKRRPVSADGGF